MRIIALALQKGGTAKTTTVLNLGTELARREFRVLLVDLDAQGSLTAKLRVPHEHNIFEHGPRVCPTQVRNMDLVPGGTSLSRTELRLTQSTDYGRLKPLLQPLAETYDFCILDAPPNLHGCTASALVAAELLVMPIPPDPDNLIAVQGTMTLLETLQRLGYPTPKTVAALSTLYTDTGTSRAVLDALRQIAPLLLESRIRYSQTYYRAGAVGLPAVEIAREQSVVVHDHQALANEICFLT